MLAGACESAALPALLRALVEDRNDDGGTLQRDVLKLFRGSPTEAMEQVMSCLAAEDAGLRRVGVWGLSALDWSQRDEYIELVVEAGSDVDSSVRSEAMSALGSVFGAGHPRAREAVMAAVRDVDPEVRRSAVEALRSWSDDETEALLLTCADDPDSWVRSQAARALAGIRRRERAPRHLLDALPHEL
ncbi:HEAT repeat-containing protein [Micromonospora citrea]|uniref:HEAT repeat-containing protein n=1 Tax=Micromonospora citrea TaxID=47855 RepID=A0A1C6W3J6_9ACTN|nr:HEAT repeat-containing protein [Micromonospora citrea]